MSARLELEPQWRRPASATNKNTGTPRGPRPVVAPSVPIGDGGESRRRSGTAPALRRGPGVDHGGWRRPARSRQPPQPATRRGRRLDARESEAWAQASVAWVRQHFPDSPITEAALHMDEGSPHVHVALFPRYKDYGWKRVERAATDRLRGVEPLLNAGRQNVGLTSAAHHNGYWYKEYTANGKPRDTLAMKAERLVCGRAGLAIGDMDRLRSRSATISGKAPSAQAAATGRPTARAQKRPTPRPGSPRC